MNTLKVYCCECGKFIIEKPSNGGSTGISKGGICTKCLKKKLADLTKE